jgi:predicted ATPase
LTKKSRIPSLKAPYLKKVWLDPAKASGHDQYPLNIPCISAEPFALEFTHTVTILVGQNGSGKSTIIEALATICGFGAQGGSTAYNLGEERDEELSKFLRAAWLPKVTEGFYTRAETIHSLVKQMDMYKVQTGGGMNAGEDYSGRNLQDLSHGEGYSALFRNKIRDFGVYIMDEPEAALSPHKQIDFVRMLHEKEKTGHHQFIIATHSPFIMAYPGACILHLTPKGIIEKSYKQTENFKIMQEFYYDPNGFMQRALHDKSD